MQPLPHLEVTDLDLISHWVGFEPEWYKKSYSISSENRTDLIEHYLSIGMDLGYNPAPGFDHKFYLSVNDDVRAAKLNPLVHYLRYGKAEGRHPLPHSSDHAFVITIQAERELSAMEQCIQAVTSGADCFISWHWFRMDPQFWLNLQAQWDLVQAEQETGEAIRHLPTRAA